MILTTSLAVAAALSIVFVAWRGPFIEMMVDLHLLRIQRLGLQVEQLADEGHVDRASAFYTYLSATSRSVGCLSYKTMPSLWLVLYPNRSAVRPPLMVLRIQAEREATHQYLPYAWMLRRLKLSLLEAFCYGSLPVWAAVRLVGALDPLFDPAGRVLAWMQASPGRDDGQRHAHSH